MSNRPALVIAAMVLIAIGAIVALTLRMFAPDGGTAGRVPPTASAPLPAASVPTAPATDAAEAVPSAEPPPPWLQPQPAAGTTPPASVAEEPGQARREQQLARLRASMQAVTATALQRSAETSRHLRDALDTLEAMDDPALAAQIDLDAVRHNLETSVRMQAIAQQMQQIAVQPPGPERQQRIDAGMAELRRLQAQLREDVRAPGSTLPAPTALPAPR